MVKQLRILFDHGLGAVVAGKLEALGTRDAPIVLGSSERHGAVASGDWGGIRFLDGARGELSHATVEYAATGITIDGASVDVVQSAILASARNGLETNRGASLTLRDSALVGNENAGLYNSSSSLVTAENVWWGHESGPTRDSSEQFGLGAKVIHMR